jgi:UDP-N-acetylmuramoyl-L-alanyl-D-glutamate--2,6-diaminopimelate ligase
MTAHFMNKFDLHELRIQGLSLDSRTLNSGEAFIALPGLVQDGRRYISEAIQKGAAVILTEPLESSSQEIEKTHSNIPFIYYSDLRNSTGPMAAHFFEEPSKSMAVVGITGTNGKTSCSHFIAQIFAAHHKQCGIMGTLGNGVLNDLKSSNCTTLDPIQTQKELYNLKNLGAESVAMEVTSHALTQGRVAGVHFHTAIFTNLTRDHLDYHETMQNYFQAKKRLFTEFKPKFSIVNLDDAHGRDLIDELRNQNNPTHIIGYTVDPNSLTSNPTSYSLITAHSLHINESGMKAFIRSPWGEGELEFPLLGNFNLSNILASISAACVQGLSFTSVLKAIASIKTVSGRMMTLGGVLNQPVVVVDYAHTPDALSKVLSALRAHCKGKLWCVFGCGGDRDRGKRGLMAKVVEELSDKIVITQDNPRTEDPARIIEDIIEGFRNPQDERIHVQQDRREAILNTVLSADPKDIILIAGKGHEPYQIIGTEKYPFSDQSEVIYALDRRKT